MAEQKRNFDAASREAIRRATGKNISARTLNAERALQGDTAYWTRGTTVNSSIRNRVNELMIRAKTSRDRRRIWKAARNMQTEGRVLVMRKRGEASMITPRLSYMDAKLAYTPGKGSRATSAGYVKGLSNG